MMSKNGTDPLRSFRISLNSWITAFHVTWTLSHAYTQPQGTSKKSHSHRRTSRRTSRTQQMNHWMKINKGKNGRQNEDLTKWTQNRGETSERHTTKNNTKWVISRSTTISQQQAELVAPTPLFMLFLKRKKKILKISKLTSTIDQ